MRLSADLDLLVLEQLGEHGPALLHGHAHHVDQVLGAEVEGVGRARGGLHAVLLQLQPEPVVEPAQRVGHDGVGQLAVDHPDALGQQLGQAGDDLGLALDHALEVGPVHHHDAQVLVGDARGGAGLVLQQGHLPENVPRLQQGQQHFLVVHDLADPDGALLDDVQLVARFGLAADHGVLGVEAGEVLGVLFQVDRLGVGVDLGHALLGDVHVLPLRAVLQISVVGVVGLVVLALAGVVLGDLEQVAGMLGAGALEGQAGHRLVQVAHALGETLDDLHGHRGVVLDEQVVLLAAHGDQGDVGQGLGGLDVAVGGHGGHDPEEVAGSQDVAPLLLDDLDFLADPHLAAADDVKTNGVLLAFDDDIGVAVEVDDRKL